MRDAGDETPSSKKSWLIDMWRPGGTIDRGPYALIGLAGFALKHNLDRILAFCFGRPWGLFNYWIPLADLVDVQLMSRRDAAFLAAMLLLALPFIWVGTSLTLRRLRSARWPAWLVVVFFLPWLNLALFLILCLVPSRDEDPVLPPEYGRRRLGLLGRLIPDHPVGSAAMAVLLLLVPAAALTWISASLLQSYGSGVFVALPFCLGFASVLLHGYWAPRSFASCLVVSLIAPLLLAMALLAVAVEGVLCLIMAAPLACALSAMGGTLGYVLQSRPWRPASYLGLSVLTLLVPGTMAVDRLGVGEPPTFEVRSSVEIDASVEDVWEMVVAFSEIPPPQEWIFRAGIAYPVRAEISGEGVGAVRRCVFSTGAFLEPIEVWDEPRLLRFSVTENPPPMQEWTPYRSVRPQHLEGFMVSKQGQFLLEPLPGQRTRLVGTTWYQHGLRPAFYWRLWSDAIIHRIHLRVLHHIERSVERSESARLASAPGSLPILR